MAGILLGDSLHHGMAESGPYSSSYDRHDEVDPPGSSWYMSRKEIEENSPSRKDGMDLKKEAYLRKSYCTFLQDLGMRLKVPQVTIATAIVFCHRFFLRQSHVKNDRRIIATVCMFLAGKVEETPRPLKDVILVSYEIIHKKDPAAVQRIKQQKEVYEHQKELILLGERVVLTTLGFDLNVHHPYKPLVEAIKKFNVAQNALAQVAWNFVNDGLRTSLCLQFKHHHIAAGAIFLAAKFLKVKLPSDGDKVWWQEFDVNPRTLEEVSNQMLELYEQNRVGPPFQGNEAERNSASGSNHSASVKSLVVVEEPPLQNGYILPAGTMGMQHCAQVNSTTCPLPDQSHEDKQTANQRVLQNKGNDDEPRTGVSVNNMEGGHKDRRHNEPGSVAEAASRRFNHGSEHPEEPGMPIPGEPTQAKDRISGQNEGLKGESPMMDAIKKIDKDKVKAALEKRRKSRADVARKMDVMDEDDLIERELESGIELAAEDERTKQERRHSLSKPYRQEPEYPDDIIGNGNCGTEIENSEEGELSLVASKFHSPEPASRKRKAGSPGKLSGVKEQYDLPYYHAPFAKHQDDLVDSRAVGRHERAEKDNKRLREENQL